MNNFALRIDWEIAVVLNPQPQVTSIQKDVLVFDFLGDHFEDVGLGYHNGFYDFLRDRTGAITGIRYFPCPDAEKALKGVAESKDITRRTDGNLPILLIFWGPNHSFDPDAPCHQYFGNNFIYRAKRSGKLAVGFAIDVLAPQERASLKRMAMG